ncbi:MAG: hypothetical protein RBR45_11840 [Pseudomonas sp.]|jgi:hypothetical protein|nr:hypothetical protein [Pseudomonas sp.]
MMSKCEKCGKTDFNDADGCLDAGVYSAAIGDWTCAAGSQPLGVKFAWQSPETAPRDKPFIAHFDGYPWALVAMYSPAMGQIVIADIEASTYQGKDDLFFTTEWFGIGELLGWMGMPELPGKHK